MLTHPQIDPGIPIGPEVYLPKWLLPKVFRLIPSPLKHVDYNWPQPNSDILLKFHVSIRNHFSLQRVLNFPQANYNVTNS